MFPHCVEVVNIVMIHNDYYYDDYAYNNLIHFIAIWAMLQKLL